MIKPYPEYKNSGVEWIGEIPKDWEVSRIKNHIELAKSGDWGSEKVNNENDMVCVRVADFDYDKGIIHNEEYTIRNITSDKNDLVLKKDDLLLEKSGGGEKQPVGRVVMFNNDFKAVCSNFITKLKIKEEDNSKYFYYLFKALYSGKINTKSIKQTTGIQNLDSYSYFMEKISTPYKEEQTRIVSFLDKKTSKIDKTIEKDTRLIELLQEKRTALINHVVTKGLDPEAPMKDSGIEWIGEIPEEWEIRRLKYNCLVNPSDKKSLADPKTKVNFLPMEKVSEDGEYDLESKATYESVSSGYTYFENRDVLLAKITPCFENGKGALVENLDHGFGFGTTEFHVLRFGENISPNYLYYLTKSHLFRVLGEAFMEGAAGQKRVSTDFVKDFPMPTPNLSEQIEIVAYLEKETKKIDKIISKIQTNISLLQEYKKSLIHHAVTGKIDVRDVV